MYLPDNGSFYEWILAVGKWAASIFIGVLGMVSYQLSKRRQLTFLEWLGICGVSVLIGYLTAVWCVHNQLDEQGYFIVPIATLFGEKIMQYFTDNFKPLLNRIIDAILKPKQ